MAPSSAAWKPLEAPARPRCASSCMSSSVQQYNVERLNAVSGAGLEQRLEIRAAGEIDAAELTPPAGCECEAGMHGGVAAVDREVEHGREVGGEAHRNKVFHSAISFGWSGRLEEAGAPAIHEAKENSGWPYSETSERSSRSSAGKQKVGESSRKSGLRRTRLPVQRHHDQRRPLRRQQPAARHRGPVP
ncbi:hypothetical protein VPH35_125098 [Triticum aestivum]